MRSSTSSSDGRFLAAFALTFLVLAGGWELVLRSRSGATLDFSINSTAVNRGPSKGDQWAVFGNCLMLTGVSPKQLNEELGHDQSREIVNISQHEQSPIAFFQYFRRANKYPNVVITNVSSWLNGTNFDQEGALVIKADPLGLLAPVTEGAGAEAQSFRKDGDESAGRVQARAEATLSKELAKHVRFVGHRYHLFDYALFVKSLATTGNMDDSLYQLNMQSWFTVKGSETDGFGFVGMDVAYREDWSHGLDQMADRSLQRLRLSRMLTPEYWTQLESGIRDLQAHGTRVIVLRMPEHPKIREFNDETYDLPGRLRALEGMGVEVLDLSALGPADGVRLFDGVHPDADAARVITADVGRWLRARPMTTSAALAPPEGG